MSSAVEMSKSLAIEIIHLSCEQNKGLLAPKINRRNGTQNEELVYSIETIKRQIKYHLNKILVEEIQSVEELEEIKFESNSPNLRYYYEEKQLYRMRTVISFGITSDKLIRKALTKICSSEQFSNSWFTVIDHKFKLYKYLSANNRINTHLTVRGIKSFSLGNLIDLTNFVEHYNSSEEKQTLNVAKDDIIAEFKLDEKFLELVFRLTSGKNKYKKEFKSIRYKLIFNHKSINSVIFSMDEKSMRIFVTLNHSPLLFKVAIDDMDCSQKIEYFRRNARYDRRRPPHKQKTFKDLENKHGVHTYDIQNDEILIRINEFNGCDKEIIGYSNVLMMEVPLIQNKSKAGESGHDLSDPFRLLSLMQRFSRIPIYFGSIQRHDSSPTKEFSKLWKHEFSVGLNRELGGLGINLFAIEYAFNALFSLNFSPFDELFFKQQYKDFIEKVINYSKEDPKAIEETLFELSALNDRSAIFCAINALDHIFEDFKQRNEKCKTEELSVDSNNPEIEYIRRCILTPTRFIMLPPQPTLRSRFIVNSEPEYTIRLSIREDNLQSLQFSVGNSRMDMNSIVQKMIKKPLMDGIPIGNRNYEFLGSSTSQLRDTGLILYAKDTKGRTAQCIRQSIGDLSQICRNVPKYVARLGLAFSQVMTHIPVPKNQTDVEKDIIRNDYTFSDGIGRVSVDIMEKVYKSLKIECKHRPTAMQIRYGGCKGMLVVDPNLEGSKQIIFRESMVKYNSDAEILGIIKLSAPRPLYLNRPLITILDQLGIEDKVFLKMLLNDLKILSNSMICECSATELLQSSSTLGIPYRKLFNSGIPFLSEPLFRQILDSVINHRINELKLKGRIKVPMNSGRTVFGVLDETGTLQYGQVFVQLSKVDADNMPFLSEDNTDVLKGEIMVTKFPCLHPGDVRKLEAVDVKELHHIKDCIVFPQKGPRPHCDEMAGSDLDGDEYAVIWDSPLIFKEENKKPMDFPHSEPTLLEKDAELEDIIDFYCSYIVSNNVGLLASAHLAKADVVKDGIFSEVCMSLAKKYSVALDFAKTGRVESINWKEKPFIYPDFMEKFSHRRTKLSPHALGQLYRHCERLSLGMASNKNLEITVKPNESLKIEGYEEYMDSATIRYTEYKRNIENLLNRFGVDSEATLLSGTFSRTSKYMSGRSETNDVHDLLENIINKLFIRFKGLFKSDSKNDTPEEKLKRVSAWYLVPFLIDDQIKDKYFGFSWTITEELCDLFKSKQELKTNKDHNCSEFAAKLIDDFFKDNYLYCEPKLDPLMDIKDQRQKIMEERCKTVEIVLRGWLERQDHLFFKRFVRKRLISSTDYVLSDMDRKLRRKLMEIRIEVLGKARNTEEILESAGSLLMNFFKNSINEWFSVEALDDNNRIVDTPLVKFGFSAFITLNHFFKTREISHIINLSQKFTISLKAVIKEEVYYIDLPLINKSTDDSKEELQIDTRDKFTRFMVQRPEEFAENLKRLSGAIEIFLEPYPLKTRCLRYYYLMTVTGTVWSVQTVKNFICHPSFFKIVANSEKKWKKPNLRYKANPFVA